MKGSILDLFHKRSKSNKCTISKWIGKHRRQIDTIISSNALNQLRLLVETIVHTRLHTLSTQAVVLGTVLSASVF